MAIGSKFRIGDLVEIINIDYVYTTFYSMFESMNFQNKSYNSNENADVTLPFEIFEVKFFNNQFLYGIRNGYGHELLFSKHGLSFYKNKPSNFKDQVLTEMKNDCETHLHDQLSLPSNVEVSISERLEGLLKLSKDNQQWLHNQLLELKQDIATLKSELN